MKPASGKINVYALMLEDAQTEIRLIIKQAFFSETDLLTTKLKVNKIIRKYTNEIKISRLRRDAIISLENFASQQWNIWQTIGLTPIVVAYLGFKASKDFNPRTFKPKEEKAVLRQMQGLDGYPTQAKGIPLQKFYKEVWYKDVKPRLDNLCQTVALDPNDFTGRNSLRNLAEMEVRYQEHQNNIDNLKRQNVKIVQCSAHEDCSERCYPWQKQRLFSLDGTYGTINGMKYIPLEVATDVWYTTKAGRRYKNGLLGFNCRHKLYEYKGELTPTVSAVKRAYEYKITQKQRELERAVRKKRVEAQMLKGINEKEYKNAKTQAVALNKKYEEFSRNHDRAFYRMRVAI